MTQTSHLSYRHKLENWNFACSKSGYDTITGAYLTEQMRELVSLLLLPIVYVLWLFLVVPWVGLQCVIVVYSDHTHLLFYCLQTPEDRFPRVKSNYENSVFQTDVFPLPISGGRQLLHLAQLTEIRFH